MIREFLSQEYGTVPQFDRVDPDESRCCAARWHLQAELERALAAQAAATGASPRLTSESRDRWYQAEEDHRHRAMTLERAAQTADRLAHCADWERTLFDDLADPFDRLRAGLAAMMQSGHWPASSWFDRAGVTDPWVELGLRPPVGIAEASPAG